MKIIFANKSEIEFPESVDLDIPNKLVGASIDGLRKEFSGELSEHQFFELFCLTTEIIQDDEKEN